MLIWIILAAVVALGLYIRLSPNDPARWHVDVPGFADKDFQGGAIRVIPGDAARLERLDQVITQSGGARIAGDLAGGHLTYLSRTRVVGFPDFTTVQLSGGKIALYGRLRFGRSDLGVNARRIEGWLTALDRAK